MFTDYFKRCTRPKDKNNKDGKYVTFANTQKKNYLRKEKKFLKLLKEEQFQ